MAFNAPCHRQLLRLIDDFHLVDTTVTGNAANASVDVSGVIEVNKLRQVVNTLPSNAASGFPALANRSQLCARLMNCRQSRHALRICGTVAIDARRRWRDRSVSGVKDRVVAIPTIHLQLASVDRMAKRYGLCGLVTDIQCIRVGEQAANGTCINTTTRSHSAQ